jgi:hypothetical protein
MIEKEFLLLEPKEHKLYTSSDVVGVLNEYGIEFNPNTTCPVFDVAQVGNSLFFLLEVRNENRNE